MYTTVKDAASISRQRGGLNRRDFLKGVGSTALAAGFIGTETAGALTAPPNQFKSDRLPGELLSPPRITAAPHSEGFWNQVGKAFPLPANYIHMNTGTTGSQPLFSLNNLAVYNLYKSMNPRDWQSRLAAAYPEQFPASPSPMAARQQAVAAAYGANPDEIVLSYNTTDACNLIFAGIPWQAGDRIITTTFEHPALAGPIAWARDYHRVQVELIEIPSNFTADISKQEVLSWFKAALDKGVGCRQFLAFSEVFYKNGLRLPVKEICALAKSYGAYTIVDSAHGWGQIPIDCHAYGADFIAGAGHKWLCGGPGVGILYVRNQGDKLPPFAFGNFFSYGNLFQAPSVNYDNRNWSPAANLQSRGETNSPALYAMSDSLQFFTQVGLNRIYERGVQLSNYLKDKIAAHWGSNALWVQKNPEPEFSTFLTAFNPFAGKDSSAEYNAMKSAINAILTKLAAETPAIYIRSITWRDSEEDLSADNRIGFRISTHAMYNNFQQIDYLLKRLVYHINAAGLPQVS